MEFKNKFINLSLTENQGAGAAFWLPLILLISFIVMLPTLDNGWVNWDDPGYVLNNPLVHSFTLDTVQDMFATLQIQGAYHPLTLLSWALDYSHSGSQPLVYHLTNLFFHLANVALVFWFIYIVCGSVQVAVLTALLFGIHPMHLEAVAWISSRKDLLYAFFFLLGLITYLKYLNREINRWRPYLLCMLFFLFSLLAKGVAITFPFVLLAIDFYKKRQEWRKQILEKAPFIALSIAFGILAIVAQQSGKAMEDVLAIAYSQSFFSGFYGLIIYTIKAFVPFQLSAFHPYPFLPGTALPWYFYVAPILVLLTAYLGIRFRNRFRTTVFGLTFFVITIAPVLQFLPFGEAIIAERFTYLSYIGLFFLLAAGVMYFKNKKNDIAMRYGNVVYVAFWVYVSLLSVATFQHSEVWQNGETLWTDVINKYPTNFRGFRGRASYFLEKGDHDRALADYSECIRLNPGFYEAYNNRGFIYLKSSKYDLSLNDFNKALELRNDFYASYINRGLLFFTTRRYGNAIGDFTQAIKLDSTFAGNYHNRGLSRQRLEKLQLAHADYNKAIELAPQNALFYKDRGFLYGLLSKYDKALADFNRAIELYPGYAEAYYWRSIGYYDLKRYDSALQDALQARKLGYSVEEEYIKSLQ